MFFIYMNSFFYIFIDSVLKFIWQWGMDHVQRTNDLQAFARFTELVAKHIGVFEKDNKQRQPQQANLIDNRQERLEHLREQIKLLEQVAQEQVVPAVEASILY